MSRKNLRKHFRSGNKPCEICSIQIPLVEHHLRGRKVKDPNKPWNVCSICPNCHDQVHLGLIVIEGWFNTTQGRELLWHKKGELSITGNDIVPPSYGD